jgi:hypothetical protein
VGHAKDPQILRYTCNNNKHEKLRRMFYASITGGSSLVDESQSEHIRFRIKANVSFMHLNYNTIANILRPIPLPLPISFVVKNFSKMRD